MGRRRIDIDISEVERLAGLGLTEEEIALSLGISLTTLHNRKRESDDFVQAIKKGKAKVRSDMSNRLYQLAVIDGNLGALIWYEKTRFGIVEPKDKPEQTQQEITIRYVNPDDKTAD